jgi:hypothetical protein
MDATTNTLTKRLITDLGLEVTLVPDTTSTYDHCWTATCAAKDCNIYPCFAPCPICPKGYCILHDDNADVHPCAQLRVSIDYSW